MAARPRISDEQRRARVVARHHLARGAADPVAVVRGVVAQHSSDPTTPALSCRARIPGFEVADLERALYEERTLWRLHAMRRTLFVVPTDEAAVFDAAAGRDIAARERRRLEGWVAAELGDREVSAWLERVERRVLEVLEAGSDWTTSKLTREIPELATEVTLGSGKWATRSPISSRILFQLAMEGRVVRTRPAGTWRSSQYAWAAVPAWFGTVPAPIEPAEGRADLARRYLASHGPVTLADVRWWTGWTVKLAAAALQDVGAVEVDLDGGATGFVLPDDVEPSDHTPADNPQVALLPGLDSTPMGWKERRWYLTDGGEQQLYDTGNAGPTVWVDGRVAGGWAQRPDAEAVFRLFEDVGADVTTMIETEAAALTTWLDGVVVTARFRTPLERELSA